jgi:tetratricopeptide (TPR) repeat protein
LIAAGDYDDAVAALEDRSAVEEFVHQRAWDDATAGLLAAALRRFPDSDAILDDLAAYQAEKPPHPTPLDALDNALDTDPANRRARESKARLLLESGLIDDAERVLDAAPDGALDEHLAPLRAELRLRQGRANDAVAELERAGGRAAVESFLVERQFKDYAAEIGAAALARYPDSGPVVAALSSAYYSCSTPSQLDELLERSPDNVAARIARARSLLDEGQLEEAQRMVGAAPEDGSWTAKLAEVQAELHIRGSRYAEAVGVLAAAGGLELLESYVLARPWDESTTAFLEVALERHAESTMLLYELDRYLTSRDVRDRVVEICDELESRGVRSAALLAKKVQVLRERDRLPDAERALREAPEGLANVDAVRVERAALRLARGQYEEGAALCVELDRTDVLRQEMTRLAEAGDVARRTHLAAALVAQGQDRVELLSDAGWFYREEGALKTASGCFTRALELDRTNLEALLGLNVVHRMMGRLDDAKRVCDEALDEIGDDTVLAELAWVHLQRNELDLAINAADRARDANEHSGNAVAVKLAALQSAGRLKEAVLLAEEVADAFSLDYDVQQQIGYLAAEREDYSTAIAVFRSAAETAPTGRSAAVKQFELGSGLLECRRYEEAEGAFRRAREHNPEYVAAYFNEGHVLWSRGRYAEGRRAWRDARKALERAEARLPEYSWPEILFVFGEMLFEAESDFRSAEEFLTRALDVDGENIDALITLIEVRLERTRNAKVAVDAGRRRGKGAAEEIEPDEAAKAYWSAREAYARCEQALTRLLDRGARSDLTLKLARLHVAMEEYSRAENVLESLVGSPARRSELYGQLGLVYNHQKRFRRAVRAFEEALRGDPDSVTTKTNLAEAYRKSGSLDAAEEQYRAVLRMAPGHVEAQIGLAELHIARADESQVTDDYEQGVSCFTAAMALVNSDRGSKAMKRGKDVLRPKEFAASLYSCGYARVKQYETSGPLADAGLLRDALKDFRACLGADPSQHKAERAIEEIQEQIGRFKPQWIEERLGPITVALLAVVIFALTQSSFFFSWPLEGLAAAFYIPVTLGALLFIVAGLFLPRILRLKVGGIELEKTAVSQVSAPSSLGIGR